jgi:hypothetical protein
MLRFGILKSHSQFNLLRKFINIKLNMFHRRLHILTMRKMHNKERKIQVTFIFEECLDINI